MSNYVLYVKTCPGVANPEHFKIGIAGLDTVRNRLASKCCWSRLAGTVRKNFSGSTNACEGSRSTG